VPGSHSAAMPHTSSLASPSPGVVCLHADASTSSQWRALTNRLAHDYRVFAPDTLGAGQGPAWPADGAVALRDEVALLEPVLEAAGTPHFLVGHSYGAAIALMAALARPQRTRALAVYEPTLFALLGEPTPLQAFEALDMPVLYMLGAQSPESSRAAARVLTQTLRNVSVIEFAELGHMGSVTHAELVNDAITQFLACH